MKNNIMRKITVVMAAILVFAMMISTFSITAFAAENESTITGSDRANLILYIDGQRAYCVERNEVMPYEETVYTSTSFSRPERLSRVLVAISQLNDGSVAFETASQYAIWQCYESTNMVMYSGAIAGSAVSNHVQSILNAADMINMDEWSVYMSFFASEGYQVIMTYGVNYIAPMVIPEFEDDKPEVTEPEDETPEVPEEVLGGDPEIPETPDEVPETTPDEVPETTPEVTPETTPDEVPETTPEVTPTNPAPVIPPQEVLGGEPTAPQTGDASNIIIWVSIMVVAAAGMVFALKSRKY